MLTVAEFLSHLRKHDPAKPVCFSRCPQGLQLYRFKVRGDTLINLEFNEGIYRTRDGDIWLDDSTDGELPSSAELKPNAMTVGRMLAGWHQQEDWELTFGAGPDTLTFAAVVDLGEWVSIDFEQRVYRDEDGRLVVEETRDGKLSKVTFPRMTEREVQAFNEEHEAPPSGLN